MARHPLHVEVTVKIATRDAPATPRGRRVGLRNTTVAIACAAAASMLAACGGGGSTAGGGGSSDEILIGVPAALTGPGAAYATPQSNAAQMVADAINASGGIKELGGAKLKLIIKDTQTNPATTGQTIRQMAQQGVSALIGPVLSPEVVANKPLIQSLKIPDFLGAGTPLITQDNVNGSFFRTSSTTSSTAKATADYILDLVKTGELKDVKNVGIVSTSTPPGDVALPALQSELTAGGIPASTVVSYDPTQVKDFAPLVAKLKAADVDTVMGFQNPNDQTLFVQALSAQDWRPRNGFFFTGSPIFLDSFRKTLGTQVSGWVTSSFCASLNTDSFTAETKKVAADFQAKYQQSIESSSGCIGATNMVLVADAIAAAKSKDPAKIAEAARTLSFADAKGSAYPYYMAPGGVKFDQDQNNTLLLTPFIQVKPDGGYNTVYPKAFANAPLAPYQPQP
jgi:branched-chain amino acid transport system substrate-binding protein